VSSEVRPRSSVSGTVGQALRALLRCGRTERAGARMSCGETTRAQGGGRAERGGRCVVCREAEGAAVAAGQHREMLAEVWGCSTSSSDRRAQQCTKRTRRRCGAGEQRQRAMGKLAHAEEDWQCALAGGGAESCGCAVCRLRLLWRTLEHLLCRRQAKPSFAAAAADVSDWCSHYERNAGRWTGRPAPPIASFCAVCSSRKHVATTLTQLLSSAAQLRFHPGPPCFLPLSHLPRPSPPVSRVLARSLICLPPALVSLPHPPHALLRPCTHTPSLNTPPQSPKYESRWKACPRSQSVSPPCPALPFAVAVSARRVSARARRMHAASSHDLR
jgi:hypothetical protein